jgi:hypothetical protein
MPDVVKPNPAMLAAFSNSRRDNLVSWSLIVLAPSPTERPSNRINIEFLIDYFVSNHLQAAFADLRAATYSPTNAKSSSIT